MTLLIGTDEAGYGPNLGPLVVSASVWEFDGPAQDDRLYETLQQAVCNSAAEAHAARVAWADSKLLYTPADGLAVLERGVLAALGLTDHWPADWRGLWQSLDPRSAEELDSLAWHIGFNAPLPLAADPDDVRSLIPAVESGLAAAGVRLLAIESRAVFPEQFNGLADHHGNKAELLSRVTLELAAGILDRLGPAPARIVCDKHGGRNRYGRLLQLQFPERLVEIGREDGTESAYAWGGRAERVEIRFRMGGESFLPVAVASMASKYLREAAMLAFNRFWCAQVPELRPTAGYPLDARRFKRQIEPLQWSLGMEDRTVWRTR